LRIGLRICEFRGCLKSRLVVRKLTQCKLRICSTAPRESKAYPNLTRAQYELLSEMIQRRNPVVVRVKSICGSFNAIFYVFAEGVRWRPHQAIFRLANGIHLPHLAQRRTWLQLHDRLRDWTRIEQGRHRVHRKQSSTVKVSRVRRCESIGGYDAGKHIKGRKRFLTVDSLGLVLRVWSPQRVLENERVANKCSSKSKDGQSVSRLHTIWVDAALTENRSCSG